jgi:hypothetical protein
LKSPQVYAAAVVVMSSALFATDRAFGMLHSFSLCAYSPWREMTDHALGSATPLTNAVFSAPERITWHDGSVEFSVFPQAVGDDTLNAAPTETGADMVTEHGAVPEHAPDQATKLEPVLGISARLTTVPAANDPVQVPLVQEIPAGLLVTVP